MSQPQLLKAEAIAEVFQLANGDLVLRPKGGRRLKLTSFARVALQVDGSYVICPWDDEIETDQAMEILGVPWSTLRRLIDQAVLEAYKRTPARWTLSLKSVMSLKEKAKSDPEFWDNLKPSETAIQGALKL